VTQPPVLSAGSSPLGHVVLLAGAPERILALRLALSSAIEPTSVVLDAGCGSLGVLSIMAARLGARRVVAVDTGELDTARALADENGVASRIEFVQCDLAELPAGLGSFDVILGMIYHNEPRRDLARQQLMAGLATRFAHSGTALIPGTVRYTVAGYDSADPQPAERTLQDRWDSAVGGAEALTGISMGVIREFPSADYSTVAEQLQRPLSPKAARLVGAARPRALLTSREQFAEVNYAEPQTASAYPANVSLTVAAPGRLDTAVWRQELKFGDLLIRRTDTSQPVVPARDVEPGDTAILSTGAGWGDTVPLTVRAGARS
jgi:SAM-dependent methyltransferase